MLTDSGRDRVRPLTITNFCRWDNRQQPHNKIERTEIKVNTSCTNTFKRAINHIRVSTKMNCCKSTKCASTLFCKLHTNHVILPSKCNYLDCSVPTTLINKYRHYSCAWGVNTVIMLQKILCKVWHKEKKEWCLVWFCLLHKRESLCLHAQSILVFALFLKKKRQYSY